MHSKLIKKMKTGKQLYDLALPHIGEKYIFGAVAPKDDAKYKGAWDCAEFTSWLVYQLTGRLYGTSNNNGKPSTADAYTGFWKRDAEKEGITIPVEQAANIPGAMVLRYSANNTIGHIAVSDGKGGTVEAHSTKTGVIKSKIAGRRWDIGILVPGIAYEQTAGAPSKLSPLPVVYRLKTPYMKGEKIKLIQRALNMKLSEQDGIFGKDTEAAVRSFQLCSGLVPDGEVGTTTAQALKIKL